MQGNNLTLKMHWGYSLLSLSHHLLPPSNLAHVSPLPQISKLKKSIDSNK